MKRRPLFWKLYPSFVLISFVSLLAVTIIACLSFKTFHYQQRELDLEVRAKLIKEEFAHLIQDEKFEEIQDRAEKLGEDSNTRITIILPSGKVIGDNKKNPLNMDNHRERPEILDALQSGRGISVRYGYTLKKESMYFAMPIKATETVLGIIRTSTPLIAIQEALWGIYTKISIGFSLFIILIAISSWWVSKTLSQPLELMKIQAQLIAQGDFSSRVQLNPSDPSELVLLAQAINEIAIQLNQRIETVLNQRNEQEAVFSSMLEGVIAIDTNERILRINAAAYQILGIEKTEVHGMTVQEVIRNAELQKIVLMSLKKGGPVEKEIETKQKKAPSLFIQSAPLLDIQKKKCGIVVVINDITKLKQLEVHRKEFVANVSHELRTPLTTIQGFAETLLNPSVSNQQEKDEFIQIIHRQAARLGAILEDLLTLSRLEKEGEDKEIKLSHQKIKPTLESALSLCQSRVSEKKIAVELHCADDCIVKHNAPLIEQAVVNLLDNAIKYSNSGSTIILNVNPTDKGVTITVSDQGSGIAKAHLPRLFERFYRVDKARSREMGGTGLGLSIVKHISLAHGGSVEVESTINMGSVFSINLPT
ncbi:MAG: ATP-binding protein [Nitrospiria bacterium]